MSFRLGRITMSVHILIDHSSKAAETLAISLCCLKCASHFRAFGGKSSLLDLGADLGQSLSKQGQFKGQRI